MVLWTVTVTYQPVTLMSFPDLVAPCFGVHPLQGGEEPWERQEIKCRCSVFLNLDAALPLMYKHSERLTAIGEIGLDFTPWCAPTQQDRDDQATVFVKQLEVARELVLPVKVHSRSDAKVTIEIMKAHGVSHALLHNFAGKPSVALEGMRVGYLFSFPPALLRTNREKLIKQLPLENICLETDSPALGPVKHVRNELCNNVVSCCYVANIRGVSPQTVRFIWKRRKDKHSLLRPHIHLTPRLPALVRLHNA